MSRTLRRRRDVRPGWAAFGLIGLLIVMAIVLYLMFGAGGGGTMQQALNTRNKGRELAVEVNTHSLVQSIVAYQTMNGELPADVAALESPGAFRDPWGTELTFEYEDPNAHPVIVIIKSAGPDGQFDTEDDTIAREQLPL